MKRLICLSLLIGLATGCQEDPLATTAGLSTQSSEVSLASSAKVTVMTRNMYIGADVDRVLEEPIPELIPVRVAEAWQTMQQTDFPARSRAIAAEIAAAKPHLVGLQEVYLVRTQEPGDFQLNAQTVAYDFLASLMSDLADLGADYTVVGQVENSDVELPRFDPSIGFADVRVTDYDVVLARSDVEVSNVTAANYSLSYDVHGFTIKRGYIMLDAEIREQTFRFVNTHPEPGSTAGGVVRDLQHQELLAILASETRPTILLGDLNAKAPETLAYQGLLNAGFQDAWTILGSKHDDGLTCCHLPALNNPMAEFYERIDLVMLRNIEALIPSSEKLVGKVEIVGKYAGEQTDSGIWPSDHAGVVAALQFPVPGS